MALHGISDAAIRALYTASADHPIAGISPWCKIRASGGGEGGCKRIVGARLKPGGMRWTVNGANAIIALQCAVESNRFDDFWERRDDATA